jgi:hypothetical protein
VSVGTAAQLAAVMKSAEPGSWSKVTGNAAIRTEEATVASKADMLRVLHPRPIAAKKFRRPEPNRTAHCYRPAWLEFGDYYIDKVASSCCMTLPLGAYTFDPTQCRRALSQTKARIAIATSFWAIRELAGQGRRSYLLAVTPIADKGRCGRIVRFVPIAGILRSPTFRLRGGRLSQG